MSSKSKSLLIGLLAIVILATVGYFGINTQKNDELEIEFVLVYEDGTEKVYKKDVFSGIKRFLRKLVIFDPTNEELGPITTIKPVSYTHLTLPTICSV